jgi:membrane associated rhomboid family serine protease
LERLAPQIEGAIEIYFGLVPAAVVHYFMVWQLFTYSFLHSTHSLMHLLMNMLTLWMFGSQEEQDWGSRKFLEFYFFCVIGAALVTVAVSYTVPGVSPLNPTIGASGGIYGLLIAFGMLYGDREVFLFPFPFSIKAKYLVGIIIFIVVIATFQPSQGGVANFAHLGGLLFGFLYIKFIPGRGLLFGATERYFGMRNDYYRWKRRQAAKKFEVYMRQHDRDVHFDEHGNYVPPDDDPRKGNGGSKSGWVN